MPYYSVNTARYYQTPFSSFPEDLPVEQQTAAAPSGSPILGGIGALGGAYGASKLAGYLGGSAPASAVSSLAPSAIPEGMVEVASGIDGATVLAPSKIVSGELIQSAPGSFSLSGIGTTGNLLLPAAGALGMGDILLNKRGPKRGAVQGALSGAAIGSTFGMPIVGAGVGGLIGLGKGLLDRKPRTNVEQDRWKKLGSLGYSVPNGYDNPAAKRRQLFDTTLAPDFVGNSPTSKEWVNNKFAKSRNEKDLVGKDLVGYATFLEKFGKEWQDNYSLDQKEKIAQKALDLGLVNEHHGTVDVKYTPELEAYAKQIVTPPAQKPANKRGR